MPEWEDQDVVEKEEADPCPFNLTGVHQSFLVWISLVALSCVFCFFVSGPPSDEASFNTLNTFLAPRTFGPSWETEHFGRGQTWSHGWESLKPMVDIAAFALSEPKALPHWVFKEHQVQKTVYKQGNKGLCISLSFEAVLLHFLTDLLQVPQSPLSRAWKILKFPALHIVHVLPSLQRSVSEGNRTAWVESRSYYTLHMFIKSELSICF